jgi:hypothetical protein
MVMTAIRYLGVLLMVAALALAAPPHAEARTVGQVIDDTAITTEIKAKLVAERLSNLTRIEVTTENGIVTLGGVVDEPERAARAAQIASGVGGVRGIVNRIHVSGTTIPPAPPVAGIPPPTAPTPAPPPNAPVVTPPAPSDARGAATRGTAPGTAAPGMSVDATGVIASVDRVKGIVTLQDGRVVRLTERTMVWQPVAVDALRPGTRVYVREAAPAPPSVAGAGPEWRMGTVRLVDRTTNQVVLTDGTIVRVPSSAVVRRGSERLLIDQILPGSEIVVRTVPNTASAEGSALPGATVSTTIDAAEITVVWTPVNDRR